MLSISERTPFFTVIHQIVKKTSTSENSERSSAFSAIFSEAERYLFFHIRNIINTRLGVKSVEKITGMKIKLFPSCKNESVRYGDITYSFSKPAMPMFEITDNEAEIPGTYESGLTK